ADIDSAAASRAEPANAITASRAEARGFTAQRYRVPGAGCGVRFLGAGVLGVRGAGCWGCWGAGAVRGCGRCASVPKTQENLAPTTQNVLHAAVLGRNSCVFGGPPRASAVAMWRAQESRPPHPPTVRIRPPSASAHHPRR